MMIPRFATWMFPVGLMILGSSVVYGQTYPSKTIRIVTSGVGGGNDFTSRLIAPGLAGSVGQPVIVENRPSGVIVVETVVKAPPDGYTLLVYSDGLWVLPLLQKVPYDPVKDLSPITMATISPQILAVHPSLPVKSVKELIVLAKARPGELNYGRSTLSSPNNLAAELFKLVTGVNIVGINYTNSGQTVIALMSGEVHLMFSAAPAVMPHLKSGRLRALAVASAKPTALAPGLPTVAASGLPDFEAQTTVGVFSPTKTPVAIIGRLNQEIVRLLNSTEAKGRLLDVGLDVVASSPEQMAAAIASEMIRMEKVIRSANIRAE